MWELILLSDHSAWGFWGLWCRGRWSVSSPEPCWHHWWFGEQSQHSGAPPGYCVSWGKRSILLPGALLKQRLKRRRGRGGTNFKWLSCNIIPALNDFHPIHKFRVLVFVLNLGHDHSSRRGVKLEEEKLVHLYLIKGCCYKSFRVKKKHKVEPFFS